MERVKIETRRFAKAQRTWLKRFRGVHWLDADAATPEALAQAAIARVREGACAREGLKSSFFTHL